jgi:1-deoxy-D-xylulose-5-phosphate reductoisomerase
VTKAQALKHPNWEMGAKITIDSASLMNKGLEAIEAKWLFNLKREQIEIIVHPQSIIHSIVQFRDGSMKAQMGLPDMKLPIQYAMAYPDRLPTSWPRFDFVKYPALTFEQPDLKTFRNLALALEAMDRGGNAPCVLNAANEVAVALFLQDAIGFLEMSDLIAHTSGNRSLHPQPLASDLEASDAEARRVAGKAIPAWRS